MANVPSDADLHKLRGNQAMQASDFSQAISWYTKAIEANPTNHLFFSNRASAYLRLHKYDEALEDANRCLELNEYWTKAYSHKGIALSGLNRLSDAAEAYKEGLKHDPSSDNLINNLANLERALPRAAAPSRVSLPQFLWGSKANLLRFVVFLLRLLVVVNSIMYVLPLGALSYRCFGFVMLSSIASAVLYGLGQYGRPQFNMEYGRRLMLDIHMQYLFLSLLYSTAIPFILGVLPFFLMDVGVVGFYLQQIGSMLHPALAAKASQAVTNVAPRVLGLTADTWKRMTVGERWTSWDTGMLQYCAHAELATGVLLILWVLTPMRQLLLLLFVWQFLQMRYMTSPYMKILGLVSHRMCPQLIGTVYLKISGWLSGMGDPQQQQQRRCTIQ